MARKTTFEGDQGDVEFVPSQGLVDAMNEAGTGTPEQLARFDELNTPPVEPVEDQPAADAPAPEAAPPPERYRELRPWNRDSLAQRLNEVAADGWRLAAVVGSQIILEREITLEAFTVSEHAD